MPKSNNLNKTLGSLSYEVTLLKGAIQRADQSNYPPAISAHLQMVNTHLKVIHTLLEKAEQLTINEWN